MPGGSPASSGFRAPARTASSTTTKLRCWQAKDGSVLYTGERDSQQRFVTYIVNDKIKEEDMGPATAAPVSPEE